MAHNLDDLRSSNISSPVLLDAVKKHRLEHKTVDPLGRRKERAEYLADLRHLMPLAGKPIPEVEEHDIFVKVRDGAEVRVRTYKPTTKQQPGPLILMFHEGGFSYGDLTDEELNCRLFCRDFGAICGNVEYR